MSNPDYEARLEQFSGYTNEALVEVFNGDVGKQGWVSARGNFLVALFQTMEQRGIDLTAIRTEGGFSLKHRVHLNDDGVIEIQVN